jgi:hypothetical protein
VKTSTAGAFLADTVTSKMAASQNVVEAHWNRAGAFFAGAALGLFGSAIANPYYYPGYYNYPYWNYGYYPRYRYYGYWGYPYRYYGYYPRYRYWRHHHWR